METYIGYFGQSLKDMTAGDFFNIFCGGRWDTGRHLHEVKCPAELKYSGFFSRDKDEDDNLATKVANNLPDLEPQVVVHIH